MFDNLRKKKPTEIEYEVREIKTYTEHKFTTPDKRFRAVFNGKSLTVTDLRFCYEFPISKRHIKECIDFLKEIESALEEEGYEL